MTAAEQAYVEGYQAALAAAVSTLRHIDTLDRVPGATVGLPKFNPLWDAAGILEADLGHIVVVPSLP